MLSEPNISLHNDHSKMVKYAYPPPQPPHLSYDPLLQLLSLNLPAVASEPTCQCITHDGRVCGEALSIDPKVASAHLRDVHGLRGDSRQQIACPWWNCGSHPVQQRAIIRHILSVHLGLLKWTCPQCWKTFSRRGTAHRCSLHGASG